MEKSEAMKDEFDTKKQQIMDDYVQFKEEFKDSMKTVGTVSNPQPPPVTPEEEAAAKIAQKTKETPTDSGVKDKTAKKRKDT